MKVTFNGTVIAESDATKVVDSYHYFPRESVDMRLLDSSPKAYTCSWKGRAEYFDLDIDGHNVRDAAWSYPHPKPAAQPIAGHIAFDEGKGITINRT